MSRIKSRIWSAGALGFAVATALTMTAGVYPAAADQPAGNGVEVDTVTGVGTGTITVSGTYSCTGPTTTTIDVEIADAASSTPGMASFGKPCPALGQPFSAAVTPIVPMNWGANVKIAVESRNSSSPTAVATAALNADSSTGLRRITLGTVANSGGSVTVSGTIRCQSTETVALKVAASQTTAGGGTTGNATIAGVPCSTTTSSWSRTISPPSGGVAFQPGPVNLGNLDMADNAFRPMELTGTAILG